MSRAWLVVGVVAAVAASTGAYLLHTAQKTEACSSTAPAQWCLMRKTRMIAEKEGAAAAFAYVRDVVAPGTDYATAHVSLHYVGAAAYKEQGGVDKAMRYLSTLATNADPYYGGYMHGVFQAFFLENEADTTAALAHELCGEYEDIEDLRGETRPNMQRVAPECYHAIGHATMMTHDNLLDDALAACDTLIRSWMREWCYHGVFMENLYLTMPTYEEGIPRPDAVTSSLVPTCLRVGEPYQEQCSHFVSWTHFLLHGGDFPAAFAECMQLPPEQARICIARSGRLPIAIAHKKDFSAIRATCAAAGTYEKECIYGTAIGLSQGAGSVEDYDAGKQLCALLEDGKEICNEMVERSKESLARFVVTEL